MSANLSKFLIELASDAARLDLFLADPRGTLDCAPLSKAERAAVLAGDSARLRLVFGAGAGGLGGIRKTKRVPKKGDRKKPAKKKAPGKRGSRR